MLIKSGNCFVVASSCILLAACGTSSRISEFDAAAYPPKVSSSEEIASALGRRGGLTSNFVADVDGKRLFLHVAIASSKNAYLRNGRGLSMPITVSVSDHALYRRYKKELLPKTVSRNLAFRWKPFGHPANEAAVYNLAKRAVSATYCKGGAVKKNTRGTTIANPEDVRDYLRANNLPPTAVFDRKLTKLQQLMRFKQAPAVEYSPHGLDAWDVDLTCSLWRRAAS